MRNILASDSRRREPASQYTAIFRISWLVYFINYLGRYNYAAVMVIIGRDQNLGLEQLGLVTTVFFITYGGGQLFSGMLGDKMSPRVLISIGLIGCGCSNLLMGLAGNPVLLQVAWGLNGLCCALIWPPMVRLMTLCMPPEKIRGVLLSFQYCTAIGICFTYIFTSVISSLFSWRTVFFLSFMIILSAAFLWIAVSTRYTEGVKKQPPARARPSANPEVSGRRAGFRPIYMDAGFLLLFAAIFLMGFLKDGILTWAPQAVTDTFHINASLSVLMSSVLPLVSVAGMMAVKYLGKRYGNDDILISLLLFCASGIGMGALLLAGKITPILTIAFFSFADSCIFGINAVLTSLVPLRFASYGKVSTIAGASNSFTYLGSAFSGWGLGLLSGRYGWSATYTVLLFLCGIGMIFCMVIRLLWKNRGLQ